MEVVAAAPQCGACDALLTSYTERGGTAWRCPNCYTGEPPLDVDEYCQVLWQWLDLIIARSNEPDGRFADVAELAPQIRLAITKSNYLYRRLYLRQAHRKEKCAVHNGRWSGYAFPRRCDCSLGSYDITGWLPARPEDENPDLGACDTCGKPATVHWKGPDVDKRGCAEHA